MRVGEVAAPRPAVLHVTNGESAGNTLRQTGLGGAVLSWQDALHEGPVAAGPRPQLLQMRAAFLAECGWGSRSAILASLERRDRQLFEAERVVLWFEHDLYDQLQLVDALALFHQAGEAPELIVVDTFLGSLTSDELEARWPTRVAATPDVLAAADAVWRAFRQPEPTALAESDGQELPFLRAALLRLRRVAVPDEVHGHGPMRAPQAHHVAAVRLRVTADAVQKDQRRAVA